MKSPSIQIGPYTGTRVAEGGFATVYHVPESRYGRPVAIKWANAPLVPGACETLATEYAVLGELDFDALPMSLEYGWCDSRPFIVMDWIDGAPLWKAATLETTSFDHLLREMARVLTFIHGRGWVHGDIKPDNLLWSVDREMSRNSRVISAPVLRLLDFGLVRPVGDASRPKGAGTVGYTAPEFLQQQPADGRADWYSLGVILYEWVFGRRPFAAEELATEIAGHLEQEPDLSLPVVRPAPDWAADVIGRLLAKTADQRGQCELDILTYLAEFDPALAPGEILNSQIENHRRSELRRAHSDDTALIDNLGEVRSEPGSTAHWRLAADRVSAQGIARGILNRLGSQDRQVAIEFPAEWAEMISADMPELWGHPCVTVHAPWQGLTRERRDSAPFRVQFRLPSLSHERDRESAHSITGPAASILPWDDRRVFDFARRVTGDDEFAAEWAPKLCDATGGVPTALSDLFEFLIEEDCLRWDDGFWHLDESAVTDWAGRPRAALAFADFLGDLTPDERRLCDWMAIGRSLANTDILKDLWGASPERFADAIASLEQRGIIVGTGDYSDSNFFDRRLRLSGLAWCWRAQLPESQRRRGALQLGAQIENKPPPDEPRVWEVQAECAADAHSWDKCVHYCITAVAAHLKASRLQDALRYINLADQAARQLPDSRSRAHWLGRAIAARGKYLKTSGQIDEALRSFRRALRLGREYHDRRLLAEVLVSMGDLYRMTRRFEKGVRVLRRARQIWNDIDDQTEVARTLNNLGNMYWIAADHQRAREYYEEGLRLAREQGMDRQEALVLSNLGVTFKCDHDLKQAKSHYLSSLEITERLGLRAQTALTLNNLGVIALDQGQLDEAAEDFERAIALNQQVGADVEILFNRGNLIQVYLERGDLRTVISDGLDVVRYADSLGDVATGAELRGLLAEAYLRAGDFRLAQVYLDEARDHAKGQTNEDLEAHLGLVEASRLQRLGLDEEAVGILERIRPALAGAELPRLRLEAIMIELRAAVVRGDHDSAANLLNAGLELAEEVAAIHKAAELAFSSLTAPSGTNHSLPVVSRIESFLERGGVWHWAPSFRIWQARSLALRGDLDAAEQVALNASVELRRRGNWQQLWQSLVILGEICYDRTDYGPALSHFEEADMIMREIAKTIEDPHQRRMYENHPRAKYLEETRTRIIELTA